MNEKIGTKWRSALDFPIEHEPAWRGEPFALPLPNGLLRAASSVDDLGGWYAIGEAWAQVASRFLPEVSTVLDVGCGCGKIARFLYLMRGLSYVGIDIFRPSIEWCRRAFEPLAADRFQFVHFDGHSEVYNPEGTIKTSEFVFPVGDGVIDLTICASLFPHLFEPDLRHYLQEIRRVSKPGGGALVSIHDEPTDGERFSGDQARIDIDAAYFEGLVAEAGLPVEERIGNVYGQKVFLLRAV